MRWFTLLQEGLLSVLGQLRCICGCYNRNVSLCTSDEQLPAHCTEREPRGGRCGSIFGSASKDSIHWVCYFHLTCGLTCGPIGTLGSFSLPAAAVAAAPAAPAAVLAPRARRASQRWWFVPTTVSLEQFDRISLGPCQHANDLLRHAPPATRGPEAPRCAPLGKAYTREARKAAPASRVWQPNRHKVGRPIGIGTAAVMVCSPAPALEPPMQAPPFGPAAAAPGARHHLPSRRPAVDPSCSQLAAAPSSRGTPAQPGPSAGTGAPAAPRSLCGRGGGAGGRRWRRRRRV